MTNDMTPAPEDDYILPTNYENLLARQVVELDKMFEKYRVKMAKEKYFSETWFEILMRTQGHCRASIEILRKLRKDAGQD